MQNKPLQSANQSWGHAQILNSDGNPFRPETQRTPPSNPLGGGTSGGDGGMTERITLAQNVKGLNIVFGLLAAAFAGAFLFFLIRIDDRFDRVDEPLREVQKEMTETKGQIETLDAKLSGKIDLILERTNGDPQRGQSKK